MHEKPMIKRSATDRRAGTTNWQRVDTLREEEVEEAARAHAALFYNCRRVGSNRSRSQSPVRLADITSKVIAMPGMSGNHQAI